MIIFLNFCYFIIYYYIKFYFQLNIIFNFFFNSLGLNSNMFSYFLFNNYYISCFLYEGVLLNFQTIKLFKTNYNITMLNFLNINNFIYLFNYSLFCIVLYYIFFNMFKRILNFIYYDFFVNFFNLYVFLKSSNYNFLYQLWYKFARNQKNTYLAFRFRLVYLNKKFVKREILNDNIYSDQIQEYFILKKKTFFDSHLKPTKIRKFVPLINLKRKFYSIQRRKYNLKGLLFFYFKDYEDRINKKEAQQKTLRIYEGIYGTYIYQELLKKEDQKQAKFIQMKLNRS